MEYVVQTNNVSKYFKKYAAVDNVNINIKRGEIFGFVGRNGAGKTTFMKMVCGLTTPTSGEIKIFGASGNEAYIHRKRIGNLIEDPGVYPGMTAIQNLKCKSIALGINKEGYEEELLEIVGLKDTGKKKVKDFSLGMRQRLGIALAMVGDPDFLVLDEPINGLDPQGIAEVRQTLKRLRDEKNMTIMISSHILDELYRLADTFCFINKGKVIEQLSKEELDEKSTDYMRLVVDNTSNAIPVLENFGIKNYKVLSNNKFHIYESLKESGKINTALVKAGIVVEEITIVNESLEKYYLGLTGGESND